MNAAGVEWYVVRTHAHAERKAAEHLRRQGFETFLPFYRRERRHARRRQIVAAPLFPRYCFVAIDVTRQRWHAIRSTLGIEKLLGGKTGPSVVRDEVIIELMRRQDKNGFIVMQPDPCFTTGQEVRLLDGAFSLHSALVEGLMDRDRVAVLLEFLGRQVRAVVNKARLAAL